ncbi:ecto-ADP-ribosyltransferase 4-like [Cottoperca gobio]|uniref:NAD(P)(+)--arginine ADP-ribosyltransferase n=1 Tax=Cottoperca gobio TaxID=56716 RepID=A0A6J2QBR6_COTGO|nr:ecto-ADP-ribosyltransferase 4-like [Cottoperca gobio]
MNSNMLICAPVCLFLCLMLSVVSKKIVNLREAKQDPIRLSMVEDSVDDMYFGCDKTMTEMMKVYFDKENHEIFKTAWKKAGHCANKKQKGIDKGDEALTKDHLQAICVYTSENIKLYEMFNHAVRTNRSGYGTSFPFHFLHFWLTSAVQILNTDNTKCHNTYRRTNVKFRGNVNETIRFGFFASSSLKKTLTRFGKTCFKIKTCSGAFLKHYPDIGNKEEEVLIPPYEMFNITKKTKGPSVDGLGDCKDVYILESAGVHSNVNCQAAHRKKDLWFFN